MMPSLAVSSAVLAFALAAPLGAQALDRSTPPELGPPPAMHLPPVQEVALPNGLTVAVVEMREVPVVDVTLLVDAGSVRDPEDLIGLATFVANMLDEGAGGRSALELAEAVDFLGARLGTFATHDYAGITLHVPKRSLSDALDVMADVLLRRAVREALLVVLAQHGFGPKTSLCNQSVEDGQIRNASGDTSFAGKAAFLPR